MLKRSRLLSLPIYMGFIWILVSIGPICVKAVAIDEEHNFSLMKPVIKVCSESAFSSVHTTRHRNNNNDAHGSKIWETNNKKGDNHWQVPSYWVSSNVTTKFP